MENTSMNFNVFAETVVRELKKTMGERFQITTTVVKKNNGVELLGIVVQEEGLNTSPTVYINDFYENYKEGTAVPKIVEALARILHQSRIPEEVNLSDFLDFETAKEQISVRLIHYEKNKKLLLDTPWRPVCNLALVCYYTVQQSPFYGKASILVKNEHLEKWGITDKDLFAEALVNTPVRYPASIEPIEELIFRNWADEKKEKLREELQSDQVRIPLFVLSNRQRLQGAVCMFYPGVLKQFAGRIGRNLYILPSSVHEVLLLPDQGDRNRQELLRMVTEINENCVADCEILADSIYYYRIETDRIEQLC